MAGATLCSASLTRHGGGWDVHFHPTLAWGRSQSINPVREGQAASRHGRVPVLTVDAGQSGGQVVGQRVRRRIDAALDTLPGRTTGPERPPGEDGMGVSMPILSDGTPRVQGGGSLRPRRRPPRATTARPTVAQPQSAQRHAESAACPRKARFRVHPPPMSSGHPLYGPGTPHSRRSRQASAKPAQAPRCRFHTSGSATGSAARRSNSDSGKAARPPLPNGCRSGPSRSRARGT